MLRCGDDDMGAAQRDLNDILQLVTRLPNLLWLDCNAHLLGCWQGRRARAPAASLLFALARTAPRLRGLRLPRLTLEGCP